MHRRLLPTCCLVLGSTALLAAEPQKLTSKMLNEMVAGSVISLDTPIGSKVPMRFGRDGIVSGEAGILAAYLGSAKDRGRWWVAKDQLCIKWFRWFESQPRCMEIRVDGDRILWRREDGDNGTATLTERAPSVAEARPQQIDKAAPATERRVEPAAEKLRPSPPPAALAEAAAPEATIESTADANAAAPPELALPPAALGGPIEAVAAEPAGEAATIAPPANEKLALSQSDAAAGAPAAGDAASETAAPDVIDRNRVAEASAGAARPTETSKADGPAEQKTTFGAAGIAGPDAPKPKPRAQAQRSASGSPAAASRKPPQPAAAEPGPSFRVARVSEDDMLNVRRGPSETHPVIGVIPSQGRGVRIVGACVEDWCPIRHAGMSGWVNRYYLAAE